MALPDAAVRRIGQFVESSTPEDARDELRLECEVRGSSVVITERRPPWTGEGDWTRLPIAQLRHDEATGTWTLYWQRANGRWERYDAAATSDVELLLAEIDSDADGVFWG